MRRYNKGEWSELYAIYLILHDKVISVADDDLEPTSQYVKILKLLMKSIEGEAEYDITGPDVAIISKGRVLKKLTVDGSRAGRLLRDISMGSGASFSVPAGDVIMEELLLDSFKANSYQKSDLNTLSIMAAEATPREVGFSVKSQLGGLSTLLNASQATNFIYEVQGFTGDIDSINNIDGQAKVMRRIQAIRRGGGRFVYVDTNNDNFKNNLRLTDTMLPDILAYMVLDYFSTSGLAKLSDVARRVIPTLPFEASEIEVISKVKQFLSNVALGMVPKKPWDGTTIAGGCIFVKRDGKLVVYTLYDMDKFNDYLINNTKFDTASTTRHRFGKLYGGADGKLYFDLNTDIRFIH